MTSAGLYEEVRDSVGRILEAGVADPLDHFGLGDLLASVDPGERNAAFAVAEAQGQAGAVTNIVSQIALAGLDLAKGTGYATTLEQRAPQAQRLIALIGGVAPGTVVLLDDAGAASGLDRAALTPVSSSLDPEYLTVFRHQPGSAAALNFSAVSSSAMKDVKARARVACAAEMLGACEAMLRGAITYAGARRQFGAPLSSFQAVAHSLAWAATEIRQLRALLRACLTDDALGSPHHVLATVTKSMAGNVSRRVAQTTLQVTGGMGFTWEYSHNALHRRVLALDAFGGSTDTLNRELGEYLRHGGGLAYDDLAALSLPAMAARLPGRDTALT